MQYFTSKPIWLLIGLVLILITGCAPHVNTGDIWDKGQQKCLTYSACLQPIKKDLQRGRHEKICRNLDQLDAELKEKHKYDDNFAESMGMLNLLEICSVYLQTGRVDKSLEYSRYAECLIKKRNNEPLLWEKLRGVGTTIGNLTGGGEYSVYDPPGWEKVLLLNLEAMNYLLKGDDRAFNIARLSTEWQEEEKEKFEEHINTLKKQPKKWDEEEEGVKVSPKQKKRDNYIKNKVFKRLAREFGKYNRKALKVPSAFVNPFGDYLAGVAMEFRGTGGDPLKSMYDNARIQYKNALELNSGSRVLKLAHKDMLNRRSSDRLVQLVAFDGFVPEKTIFKFDVKVKQCPIPIHLEVPMYEPVKSKVGKIVVTTSGGRGLATFRPVANLENLALRHQKDMLPAIQALVAVAAVRDVAIEMTRYSIEHAVDKKMRNKKINDALKKLLGGFMGVLDRNLEPDTSSWMSLPKRIMAARFHPPKHLKTIVITSYDRKGRRLARQKVKLGKGGRHFIFVRTIDRHMKVIPGKKIWSPKEKIRRIDC